MTLEFIYGKYDLENNLVLQFARRYESAFSLFSSSAVLQNCRITRPEPADFSLYLHAHTSAYVEKLMRVQQSCSDMEGIPFKAVEFERIGVGGTLKAAELALERNCVSYHLGGGYHHGMPDRHESVDYCNDVAILIGYLLHNGYTKILYADVDVHHPNGVQRIFGSDKRVLQLSLHGWGIYPREGFYGDTGTGEGKGFKINLPIPPQTGDEVYVRLFELLLRPLWKNFCPQVVVYQAGLDPHRTDPIGNLNLSLRGLYRRDRLIGDLRKDGDIPLVAVLGGGYAEEIVAKGVVNTIAALTGQAIVFPENPSIGAPTKKKAFSWCAKLLNCVGPYHNLLNGVSVEGLYD